jgi:hypothetical protein
MFSPPVEQQSAVARDCSIEQAAHRPDEWIDLEDLELDQRVFERPLLGQEPAAEVADGSVPR